ncbi:hypothetical protein ILUMI_06448 [Ignelater luminosus]|uniref:Uncharacterized protein n=1 Tax=Ignelater luminosus TaxID=2038154 RepID=A0A8K0DB21_IGNLU|nr:hypothetical protein ILUMI_06448 [Ignelater luminosus]
MTATYSYGEQTDMLLVPNHKTFARMERRLREYGRFKSFIVNYGRSRVIRNPQIEEEILNTLEEHPEESTRSFSRQMEVSKYHM